ncbi:MAG: SpoIVB peptidase [Clostridiales bacterium]|nr:SpoIVB peptidase [Clostridiales bacterium]
MKKTLKNLIKTNINHTYKLQNFAKHNISSIAKIMAILIFVNAIIFSQVPQSVLPTNAVAQEEIKLVPCGDPVGINIDIGGIMVVGVADVISNNKYISPGKKSGIKLGDIIISVNGQEVKLLDDFLEIIENSNGEQLNLVAKRGNKDKKLVVQPVLEDATNLYKVGIWVRDSNAGIGTLTYFNPQNNTFGALGHAVVDGDTGKKVELDSGSLFNCYINSVKEGVKGEPGELKGTFMLNEITGTIESNNSHGVFGVLDESYKTTLNNKALPIAKQDEVIEGDATILCSVNSNVVSEYKVKIDKIYKNSIDKNKDMIIEITDPSLLDKTGGIVQGMSGSPIIQNEKIIGAITHVLINDPAKGYGTFINNMLEK